MSVHRQQSEARHAQSLRRFAAKREELAALFDIDLLAHPPPAAEIFEPVRGARFTFDVSCMVCGAVSRFDRAPTFPILIQRMEMARWLVGGWRKSGNPLRDLRAGGWRKPDDALQDLRAYRACSECAGEAA